MRAALAAILLAGTAVATASAQSLPDAVSTTDLRVCADPHDLPFSNEQGQGYENKIAELIAADLHLHVAYTWFPDSQGFVRGTLMKHTCDVVIGTVAGVDDMATTDSYLHTGYVMLTRTDDHVTTNKVDDWHLGARRFGIVAATPPTNLIIDHNLMDQTSIYSLVVDTRIEQPAHTMIQDLAAGKIDVGLIWGPIAGYFVKHDHLPLTIAFLDPEASKVRLDYHIAMGVRQSDVAFRRRLNSVIARKQPEITQILRDYGIPMLDEQDRPAPAAPARPGQAAPLGQPSPVGQ